MQRSGASFGATADMGSSQIVGPFLVRGYITAPFFLGVPQWDPNVGKYPHEDTVCSKTMIAMHSLKPSGGDPLAGTLWQVSACLHRPNIKDPAPRASITYK